MTSSTLILGDVGDLFAPKGSLPWVKAAHNEAMSALNNEAATRENVQAWVNALREENRYRLLCDFQDRPYLLWETFCTTKQPRGLGYNPDAIAAIIAERRPATPAELIERVEPLAGHGGDHKSEQYQDSDTTLKGSRDAAYLAARIKRDHPDIAAKLAQGKYKSVRQAAIDAGIIQPRISVPCDPEAAARILRRHFTPDQLAALRAAL